MIAVGTLIPVRKFTVEPEPMKVFSLLTADPNPIHWDRSATKKLGLGDRTVNQGGLNMAYVVRAITDWSGSSSTLRSIRVRFLDNVFEGDRLDAGGTVTALRHVESSIVADVDIWLRTEDGRAVLSGKAAVDVTALQTADLSSSDVPDLNLTIPQPAQSAR